MAGNSKVYWKREHGLAIIDAGERARRVYNKLFLSRTRRIENIQRLLGHGKRKCSYSIVVATRIQYKHQLH